MDGQIPKGSNGIDIGPAFVIELIPGSSSRQMSFRGDNSFVSTVTSSSTEQVASGATRFRFEVLSTLLFDSASFNDTFLQVYEFFDQDTTATLYGDANDTAVRADTVYYSQVIDLSHWRLASSAVGLRIVTWTNLYTLMPTYALSRTTIPEGRLVSLNADEFKFEMLQSGFVTVDGVAQANPITDSVFDGLSLLYSTTQECSRPVDSAIQRFELRISPGTAATLVAPAKQGMPGYKQSALIVGITLGVIALLVIFGFAVYFFCLGLWLPIWGVISIPGYAVADRVRLLYRPPAPRFEEDEEDAEDDDDPLGAERVDADELMKFTASAVGSAASMKGNKQASSDNVLSRLKKAMGRRLSNFVGWDGPPPGSTTVPSNRSPSPKSKHKGKHVKQASSSSNPDDPHIVTPEMIQMNDLGQNVHSSVQLYAGRNDETASNVGLLTDRDESPSPVRRHQATTSLDDSSQGEPSYRSEDESTRISKDAVREYPASSSEADPPRPKKAPGLRHFKITTSLNSSTTDVTSAMSSPIKLDSPTSPSSPSSPTFPDPETNPSEPK